MKIRRKLSILTLLLFLSLFTITGLSAWNWSRMQRLHQTILQGQRLLNQSQKVMGLMKDIIFDLFAPTMYSQIRSLTYAPRSVATYRMWQKAVDEYQLIFMDFVDDRELMIFQDDELQDIYNTALTLNQKALFRLEGMSEILLTLQDMDLEGEHLYITMQQDESLIPFFQEFRDTSYYFTNTFESYMNHFFTSFRKQSLRLERQLYLTFLGVSILAGLISVIYAAMISREILKKIDQLGSSFRKISRGDFSPAFVPDKGDELSELLMNLNELSEDLKENINSILNLTRDMGEASVEGSSAEEMLRLIVETIISDTAADGAALYLYEPLENCFKLNKSMGTDDFLQPLLGDGSYTGSALLRGSRFTGREPDLKLLSDLFLDTPAELAPVVLPLRQRERLSGFLLAFIWEAGEAFSDLGITRLINFSEYASLSLDNHGKYLELLEKREAEYNALQSQVQPHFIYNVLNSLIGLNRMGSKDELEKAILSLREMLRYVTVQERWTSLGRETDFLKSYCDLQKIRFGERLNYHFHIPAELKDFQIPKLMLQPLVENSILHGLEPLEEGGELTLSADIYRQESRKRVVLTLEDTGTGFDMDRGEQNVGLRNVKERLLMSYPGSEFLIRSTPGRGTSVLITIVAEDASGTAAGEEEP
jgi:two-component system sensor histidine kinase YesM